MEKGDRNQKNGISHYAPYRLEIDCVIFSLDSSGLKILLVKQADNQGRTQWRLANDCIQEGETITSTAHTIVRRHTGTSRYFIDQLKAFGYPCVSSLQENISIAYYGLINSGHDVLESGQGNIDMKWAGIDEADGLNDKDRAILDFSLRELRRNICQSTVGFNLLPEKFTLLQVVHLYEKILGIEINKSNFRRKILQLGLVQDLDEKQENVVHRAAKFYTLKMEFQQIWPNGDFNFISDKKTA